MVGSIPYQYFDGVIGAPIIALRNIAKWDLILGFTLILILSGMIFIQKCNDIDILIQDDSAQRTLSCDVCSECGCLFPGCYPAPFIITIDNIAKNNIFRDTKKKSCKN